MGYNLNVEERFSQSIVVVALLLNSVQVYSIGNNSSVQFQFIYFKFHYIQFKNINDTYEKN